MELSKVVLCLDNGVWEQVGLHSEGIGERTRTFAIRWSPLTADLMGLRT